MIIEEPTSAVPGTGPKVVPFVATPSELQLSRDKMARDLPIVLESLVSIAAFRRSSYLAHLKAGFDEKQALELCHK